MVYIGKMSDTVYTAKPAKITTPTLSNGTFHWENKTSVERNQWLISWSLSLCAQQKEEQQAGTTSLTSWEIQSLTKSHWKDILYRKKKSNPPVKKLQIRKRNELKELQSGKNPTAVTNSYMF